ncbi:hypothetical protein Y032_0062g3364 [Ancylostoma ceylanicum]|uniref:Uncharacterized protein n=1 Tax=Ancylostoma ceylanicum TaxID=53326 RepID=A0A016U2N1_9BILA|nr:hypothetical protein Y032_0062g3364 [Ancylostoma ceylanicum]
MPSAEQSRYVYLLYCRVAPRQNFLLSLRPDPRQESMADVVFPQMFPMSDSNGKPGSAEVPNTCLGVSLLRCVPDSIE